MLQRPPPKQLRAHRVAVCPDSDHAVLRWQPLRLRMEAGQRILQRLLALVLHAGVWLLNKYRAIDRLSVFQAGHAQRQRLLTDHASDDGLIDPGICWLLYSAAEGLHAAGRDIGAASPVPEALLLALRKRLTAER